MCSGEKQRIGTSLLKSDERILWRMTHEGMNQRSWCHRVYYALVDTPNQICIRFYAFFKFNIEAYCARALYIYRLSKEGFEPIQYLQIHISVGPKTFSVHLLFSDFKNSYILSGAILIPLTTTSIHSLFSGHLVSALNIYVETCFWVAFVFCLDSHRHCQPSLTVVEA